MFRLLLISLTLVFLMAGGPGNPVPEGAVQPKPPAATLEHQSCCGPQPCPPPGCGDGG